MARIPLLRGPKAFGLNARVLKPSQTNPALIHVPAALSSSADCSWPLGPSRKCHILPLVVRPYGIVSPPQSIGVRRPEGEDVEHMETAAAEVSREPKASPNSGVVLRFVRRGGIEANEDQRRTCRVPRPPQRVAPDPTF